jgi:nicotinamide riboside kinase
VTRDVLRLFGKVDWSIPELRDYVFIKQLMEEKEASLTLASNIIVDAGIISIVAHDRMLLESLPDRASLMKYFAHQKYEVVFFCDHREIPIQDDGERYTDETLRNKLASLVEAALLSFGLKDYCVLSGSRSERLDQAIQFLEGAYAIPKR